MLHKLLYIRAQLSELPRIFHIVAKQYHIADFEFAHDRSKFLRYACPAETEAEPLARRCTNVHSFLPNEHILYPTYNKPPQSRTSSMQHASGLYFLDKGRPGE